MAKSQRQAFRHEQMIDYVTAFLEDSWHAKRIASLASCALGVMHAAALGVAAIGKGMAQALGLDPKHSIKQVDRFLSNQGIDLESFFEAWVPHILAQREEAVVALDWTEFDADDQSTLAIHLVTRHGRATPLMWKTVAKTSLKGNRTRIETELLASLHVIIGDSVHLTVLADRGFGSTPLYDAHQSANFSFVIRFKGNIEVTDNHGETRKAADWLHKTGRARILRNVYVTGKHVPIPAVVCVRARGMKEPWFLACGGAAAEKTAQQLVKLYGRRFSIEEGFRDTKDMRFGMGLSASRIGAPARRDRILMLSAIAVCLLTLLGAAGENLGHDRLLKANTSKKRTHSLFTQGRYYYGAIPTMKEDRLKELAAEFGRLLEEHVVFSQIFGTL